MYRPITRRCCRPWWVHAVTECPASSIGRVGGRAAPADAAGEAAGRAWRYTGRRAEVGRGRTAVHLPRDATAAAASFVLPPVAVLRQAAVSGIDVEPDRGWDLGAEPRGLPPGSVRVGPVRVRTPVAFSDAGDRRLTGGAAQRPPGGLQASAPVGDRCAMRRVADTAVLGQRAASAATTTMDTRSAIRRTSSQDAAARAPWF